MGLDHRLRIQEELVVTQRCSIMLVPLSKRRCSHRRRCERRLVLLPLFQIQAPEFVWLLEA
eukprot:2717516-Amphidinium_carterae.1